MLSTFCIEKKFLQTTTVMGNCVCSTNVKYDDIFINPSFSVSVSQLEIDNLMEQVTDEIVLEFKCQKLPSCPRKVVTFQVK